MIGELSERFVEYISEDKFTTEETEEMKYIVRIILYELIKMIGVILIFGLVGYFKEALIILIVMCFTRPYIGGYHEKTQMRCFIASMLFTAGELLLSKQCSISFFGNCILLIICIFAIYKGAPVIDSKMPITRPELIRKNRIRAIRNSIILSVVSIGLYKYTLMYSLITWTLLIEVLMMFDKREN